MGRMKRIGQRFYRFLITNRIPLTGFFVLTLFLMLMSGNDSIFDSARPSSYVNSGRYRYRGGLNDTRRTGENVNFTWNSVLDALEHVPGKGDFLPSESGEPSMLYRTNKPAHVVSDPLMVYVLLHSHNDPGYRRTFDDYYNVMTKRVLTLAVKSLMKHEDLTFIWTDTCFLERWWREQNSKTRNNLRYLARSGRFEISLGAWVSADECIVHYFAYMDQLTEGYNWVKEHLGVYPNVSFNMDQFGSSASVNYMRSVAGVKHSFVNHLHKGTKKHFRKHRLMEFYNRQTFGKQGMDDALLHIEPYDNLAFRGSCGPDEFVCLGLDERHFVLPSPNSLSFKLPKLLNGMPYWNVHQFAERVVEQLNVKNDGYLHRAVLLPLGNDLIFYEPGEWENQHGNMRKLMDYINSYEKFNVKMQFGTLSQYFNEVQRQTAKYNIKYPIVSGDYFPYTRGQKYWGGYFTTRQFAKRLGRELQEAIRATDLLLSVSIYNSFNSNLLSSSSAKSIFSDLSYARQQVYIFQHHDAITGTAEDIVVRDYKKRLSSALISSQEILSKLIGNILDISCSKRGDIGSGNNPSEFKFRVFPTLLRNGSDELTRHAVVDVINKPSQLILYNSYTQRRSELVTVHLKHSSGTQLTDHNGHPVDFDTESTKEGTTLTFIAQLPPVSISVYSLSAKSAERSINGISPTHEKSRNVFVCENSEMEVKFSLYEGTPMEICYKNGKTCVKFKMDLVHYTTVSDAWTFPNSGDHVKIQDYSSFKTVNKTTHCSVEFFYKFITLKFILPKVDGINAQRLQLDIHDNLGKATTTNFAGDFAIRVKTNIQSGDTFYTDSNSLQLMKRTNREYLSFGANLYPMTSLSAIEDQFRRLTVHSSQPHGVTSRESGSLDVMIDRVVTAASDGTVRRFHGNTKDSLPTFTQLYFQLEHTDKSAGSSVNSERLKPSLNTVIISDLIQHPVYSFYTHSNLKCGNIQQTFLGGITPQEMVIANMKCLFGDYSDLQGLTMTLFRREISPPTEKTISLNPSTLVKYNFKHVYDMFSETSLSNNSYIFQPLGMKTFVLK